MSSLSNQQKAFKRALLKQPLLERRHIQTTTTSNILLPPKRADSPAISSTPKPSKQAQKQTLAAFGEEQKQQRHNLSHLHAIITVLKNAEGPLTIDELKYRTKINITGNKALTDMLLSNERISYRDGKLSFKAQFDIKSCQDLKDVLRDHHLQGGIDVKDLNESAVLVKKIVADAVAANEALMLSYKDGTIRYLYYNPLPEVRNVNETFVELWSQIQMPRDEVDIQKELGKAGLRGADAPKVDSSVRKPVQSKNKKQFRKRLNVTNVHLDFDVAAELRKSN